MRKHRMFDDRPGIIAMCLTGAFIWRCCDVDLCGPNLFAFPAFAASSLLHPPAFLLIHSRPGTPLRLDGEKTELAALKVLNDSELARTVRPSLQDTRCTYENPAFPDLYLKEKAATLDAMSPALPPDPVKADDSEYLIRFQSAKPVQTAVQELLAIGEKWSTYRSLTWHVDETDGPTDLANARYNVADMITVAVILKRSGPQGPTLFDYGYEKNGHQFSSHSVRV